MIDRPPSKLRSAATHAAVLAAYLGLALLHLRPLGGALATAIPRGNREDALLHGWIMNWTARALARDPFAIFDSNSFFPFPRSLAYTEHFIPEALPVAPLTWVSDNPVLIYNVAFLLSFVLGGWGTFLLVRRLTGSTAAAFVAGAFACWFPAKRWSLAHPNTIALQWLPFALLAAHRMLERPVARRVVALAVAATLAALSSAYYTVYLPVLLLIGLPLLWWAEARPMTWQRAVAVAGAGALTAMLMAPVLWQYASAYGPEKVHYEYSWSPGGGADLGDYLILDSWLWPVEVPVMTGRLTAPFFPGLTALLLVAVGIGVGVPRWRRRGLGVLGLALMAGGLVASLSILAAHHRAWVAGTDASVRWIGPAFAVFAAGFLSTLIGAGPGAVGRVRRWLGSLPPVPVAYALLALFAFAISLGQRLQFFGFLGPRLPLSWIYEAVPALAMLRAPFRVGYLGMALLAVPLGFGVARLLRHFGGQRMRALAAGALVLVMTAELLGPALPPVPPPAERAIDRWLAAQPGDFGIVELPMPGRMWQTAEGQWRSVHHWKRRVTGHNGFLPAETLRLHSMASPVLRDDFVDYLVEYFPARFVLVDLAAMSPERRRWLLEHRLPALRDRLEPVTEVGEVLVLRLLNGGVAGSFRRRFPGRMLSSRMRITLAAPVSDETAGARLVVRIDGAPLEPIELAAGQTVLEIEGVPAADPDALVWVALRLAAADRPVRVRTIEFLRESASVP